VNAKKVDLGHLYLISSDNCINRDTRYEAKELIFLASTNAKKPFFMISRRG